MAACQPCSRATPQTSEIPLLCFRDQEVAEHLDARDRLEFFRIDEERIEREIVDLAEQLHQATVFFDQIIRQHCDAEPALAGAEQAEDVGYGETRRARAVALPRR